MVDDEIINVLHEMRREELVVKLNEMRENYAELDEQIQFMLRSTGHHLRGVVRKKHEKKLKELKEMIDIIEAELKKR
jgi:hypothetical protein